MNIKTTVLLDITDYNWMKNNVEHLALVQNQHSRQSSKIQVLNVL